MEQTDYTEDVPGNGPNENEDGLNIKNKKMATR
jgi:hypothetical protein